MTESLGRFWEKFRVDIPGLPLGIVDDPSDAVEALKKALFSIEKRQGERRGWDQPPRLFTVHLADRRSRSIELRVVPRRLWVSWRNVAGRQEEANPADSLKLLASRCEDVPPAVTRLPYLAAPLVAVAYMSEGWGVLRPPTSVEQEAMALGLRTLHRASDRVEFRILDAVDINQEKAGVIRVRGADATVHGPGSSLGTGGAVSHALSRIVHALREQQEVFPAS
ncbi:hypothetical protein [Embleya scabrispora]|uniref:hypothetical protein n=1 Tax=Embleya scabrispora TaxID=159449 RepID=UPI00117C0838|nr:hypothetical protein [Embleya scabrispora]